MRKSYYRYSAENVSLYPYHLLLSQSDLEKSDLGENEAKVETKGFGLELITLGKFIIDLLRLCF